MPSYLFQAGKLSDYEHPDNYSKYWMKITKEVECKDVFNSKPYWTEEGLSFNCIPDEPMVQGHKDLKMFSGYLSLLRVWILNKSESNCAKIKSLNQDEGWKGTNIYQFPINGMKWWSRNTFSMKRLKVTITTFSKRIYGTNEHHQLLTIDNCCLENTMSF